jgi:phosphoenolpyruvate-protein phosphotransferase
MSAGTLTLVAPLAGWSGALEEAPDAVFAQRLLGDGLAIDPTAGTLCAPCDAEVLLLPPSRHAVTLRSAGGCEILLHVGIDTVALGGAGFTAHTREGAAVRAGDELLSFDLDVLARRAKSVLTPVVITGDGWRITRSSRDCEVRVGEFLMELVATAAGGTDGAQHDALTEQVRRVTVNFEHGIHARPAALMAAALKDLAAEVRIVAGARAANARSTTALMSLGAKRGDLIELQASGPDAAAALTALAGVLGAPAARAGASAPRAAAATPQVDSVAGAGRRYRGISASGGLAVGTALQLRRAQVEVAADGVGVAHEQAALERARGAVRQRLSRGGTSGAQAEIAAAHLELLDDPELIGRAQAEMAAGRSAGFAWRSAVGAAATALQALNDAHLAERVDDLLDLESQVLLELTGTAAAAAPPAAGAIVLARELLPSQVVALAQAGVAGLCMAGGGATSHAAILAAALGVPALVALGAGMLAVEDGTPLVLDAGSGVLEVDPGAARLAAARTAVTAQAARRTQLERAAQHAAATADGVRIEVLANIGSLAEAQAAVRLGAEGVGLLRTEFLFLERSSAPPEAEQRAQYQAIADALGERPLTIRTLDAGGDKPIAYLPLPPEENPALGLRGIRTSLAYPQLLRTQLRALLGVGGAAQLRVLLPMISDLDEVHAVRALVEELCGELGRSAAPLIGVMIETPAAALLADELAAAVDFLSIGTNDLTQYTLAMDRTHPQLASRLDALHPAVLRLIARTAQAGGARQRPVAVCGGLASEPRAAPLLIGLGVRELSVVPAVIPHLKARIAALTLAECGALAAQALAQPSAAAVRALLGPGPP